uniref:GUN4-like domain-containing protein n=1 Tax=Erythrocystis saccata TaxID=2822695 RepID=A0A8E6L5L1_9FLOR|nr:hypothetical protein [Erythrocystis saccata]
MEKTDKKIENIQEQIKIIFLKNDSKISSNTEQKINEILDEKIGKKILIDNIIKRYKNSNEKIKIIDGFIYQKILETQDNKLINELISHMPKGIMNLEKQMRLNYQPLQNLLIKKEFKEADKLTQKYLCTLAEKQTNKIKHWLYFTDIQFIPKSEIFQIDLLWKTYSKGRFGFSIQKNIWIQNNKKWDKLWEKINWTEINTGIMKRYPQEFNWTINAPEGHLPLFNQLRGTQTLSYLFKKIDW